MRKVVRWEEDLVSTAEQPATKHIHRANTTDDEEAELSPEDSAAESELNPGDLTDYTSYDEYESERDDEEDDDDEEEELDLGGRILKEIREETYVCLVCTSEISADEKFWPCGSCHRVYHIDCISSWSTKGSSTDDQGNWKCPACHITHRKQRFQHRCWCGKHVNPPVNDLMPGSCGQTCGAKLKGCPHKCALQCHPGPHADCNALGPIMKCRCGKHDEQWPCTITPYDEGWQCEDVCEEFLPCESHKCGRVCHDGLCGKCEEFVETQCYCGKTTDMVKCHLRMPKKSYGKTKNDNWVGNFQCTVISHVMYDCGVHSTRRSCEPVPNKPRHCPYSPDTIKTCHCGQTNIEEALMGQKRTQCTDPIPTCDKLCNKKLSCGHACKSPCHAGECSPCYEFIKSKCECGFNTFVVPCKFIQQGYTPSCTRKCTALLSCRRHRCTNICCKDEGAAMTRERLRKKGIRNNTVLPGAQNEAFVVEPAHVCLQTCNKKLSCGNPDHTCKRICHAGACPPCLESTNDDLVCHCGKTVVMAPVRCGTTLPPCPHQCTRSLPCNHPQMPHNCHEDDVPCPKCTYTLEKDCNCGKSKVLAMCYQEEVFCAKRCEKPLPCQHRCLTTCHKGPCKCTSICGKRKKYCVHVDRSKCHFPSRCDDSKSCKDMVEQTCSCGRLKKTVPCGASAHEKSAAEVTLGCDVSCAIKEREEKLKEAFGVTEQKPSVSLEEMEYPQHCMKTAYLQQRWCLGIESLIKEFMSSDKASMLFKPMRREQREFVHEMAETYGLYSESQDPEPYRSVYVLKRQNCKVPKHSLKEAIDLYEQYVMEQRKKREIKKSTPPPPVEIASHYNALLVEHCVVGVTLPDLEDAVKPMFTAREIRVLLKWIGDDKYLIVPEAFMRLSLRTEAALKEVSGALATRLKDLYLANSVKVVRINEEYSVVEECKELPKEEKKEVKVEEEKHEGSVEAVEALETTEKAMDSLSANLQDTTITDESEDV